MFQCLLQLFGGPAVAGGEGHEGGGGFDIAFAAAHRAGLAQGVALGVGGASAAVVGLADVEQQAAVLGEVLHGGEQFGAGGGMALAVGKQDGGFLGEVAQAVGDLLGAAAGGEQMAAHADGWVESGGQAAEAAGRGVWLPGVEVGVVEALVELGAAFAAADGGVESATEGDNGAVQLGVLQGGDGGLQVGGGVAIGGVVGLLRAGEDDGFTAAVERKGEEVGGVGEGVGAVQDEDAVVLGQGGLQDDEPFCPMLGGDVGAVDQGLADVPVKHGVFGIGLQGLFGELGIGNEAVGAGLHADGAAGVEDEYFLHGGMVCWKWDMGL